MGASDASDQLNAPESSFQALLCFPSSNQRGCRSLSQVTLQPDTHAHPSRAWRKAGGTESNPALALQEKEQFWWCIWCLGYLASFTHILALINLTLINPQVFREEDEKFSRKEKCCLFLCHDYVYL